MNHRWSFEIGSFSACAVFAMAIAAGCSSSSSSDASNDGGAGDGSAGDGNVITGDANVPSVCDKVPLADFQALLPATITSVTTQIGGGSQGGIICVLNVDDNAGTGLMVQTYPDDPDKSKFDYLLGGDPVSSPKPFTHPISGIGTEAYYFEVTTDDAGTGVSSPNLVAHVSSDAGASPTCGIESNDPPDTTMTTTPDGLGGFTVTQSDTVAYVQLMGKVCNDVFAASN